MDMLLAENARLSQQNNAQLQEEQARAEAVLTSERLAA